MAYQLFNISLPDDADHSLNALNAFLCTHRIVSVTHRGYENSGSPYELFIVDYLSGGKAVEENAERSFATTKEKIDYKKKLSPADFEVYLQLSRLRKRLAEANGIEVFMVYTNAQLAAMAENRPKNMTELEKINGIGDARLLKFGKETLDLLMTLPRKGEDPQGVRKDDEKGSADVQVQ